MSPLGVFFSLKRFKHGYWSKYSGRRIGGAWVLQIASAFSLLVTFKNIPGCVRMK